MLRLCLVGLFLLLAVVFLARRQIGDLLARHLDQRLMASGIYIKWGTAAWIPGPGIRLRDVEIFRDSAKTDRVFLLSNVAAIKAEVGLDRWDTFKVEARDADLVLDHGQNETKLTALQLDLVIQPGKANLERMQGTLLGWHVDARGDYLNTSAPKPVKAEEKVPKEKGVLGDLRLDWLAKVKDWATVEPGKDPPVLKLEFHSVPETGATTLAVDLDGKSLHWRGQPWDSMGASIKGTFGGEPSPIAFERIEIGHGGQKARVKGDYDLTKHVIRVSEFESGVDILALARSFAREATAGLAPLTTAGEWRITGAGHIPLDQPRATEWKGHIALTGDMTYAQGKTHVTLRQPGMAVEMSQAQVNLHDFKVGVWGGQLEAPATTIALSEGTAAPAFETRLKLANASLQDLSQSFGSGARQPGVVNVDWKGGGGFSLPAIAGSGSLSIQRAEFYRVPLFGPLHLVFDKLAPGFGRDVASSLTASHSLGRGILSIRNLELDSKYTRVQANGTVNLQSNYAHLTAKAKLQGIVGLATSILSALLEVEGEGPVSDVKWGLKNMPVGDLVQGATEVVGKTGEAVVGGTETAIKMTTDAAAGTVKGAGKAVKGMLKLPGKLIPGRK